MTATSANNRRGIFKSKKAYDLALLYGLNLYDKKSYIHSGLYISFDDVQFIVDNLWLDYFMGFTDTPPINSLSVDEEDNIINSLKQRFPLRGRFFDNYSWA